MFCLFPLYDRKFKSGKKRKRKRKTHLTIHGWTRESMRESLRRTDSNLIDRQLTIPQMTSKEFQETEFTTRLAGHSFVLMTDFERTPRDSSTSEIRSFDQSNKVRSLKRRVV